MKVVASERKTKKNVTDNDSGSDKSEDKGKWRSGLGGVKRYLTTGLRTFVQVYIFTRAHGTYVEIWLIIYKLYNGHCALFVSPVFAFYGAILTCTFFFFFLHLCILYAF